MGFGIPQSFNLSEKYDTATVKRMLDLLKASPLPEVSPLDAEPWKLGTDLIWLKKLKNNFERQWSWDVLEKKISRYDQFSVHYQEGSDELDLHYVHVRSTRPDAIPIILLHGWPGTFFDFYPIVDALTSPPNKDSPAFHVVIPSLPGYFLSTLPRRDGWSLANTARVFHELMTDVLGYETYAGHGGDWGSHILRVMGTLFPAELRVMHFNMFLLWSPPTVDPETYTPAEKQLVARQKKFYESGAGYGIIQGTKPLTIGIAIGASPLSLLAYIGEKLHDWLDVTNLDDAYVLDTVALYYLSGCFPTSVVIYNQSKPETDGIIATPSQWVPKGKIGFSAFPYEISAPPRSELAALCDLTFYKEHSRGGHFPATDCPEELIQDLREFFAENWL